MLKYIFVGAAIALALSVGARADEHRELGAHEHGHGTLNIAVEGTLVKMELEVPGADIVGFEHDPSTPEETAAMAVAKTSLAAPLALFKVPSAAKCTAKDTKISIVEEEHDHGKEEPHEKSSKPAEPHHNVFEVSYTLECQSTAELTAIEFEFFRVFKYAQELDVNVVTAKGQSKFEATRDKPKVDLAEVM